MALIPVTNILSLDQDSFKTQINGIYDHRGNNATVTMFGDATSGRRFDDVSVKFQYNIATHDTTSSVSGTGVISDADSQATISTGASIGTATLQSKDIIRYRPGHEAFAYFTSVFGTPDVNGTQLIGPFDTDSGFFVGYDGTSFGVGYRVNSVDTFIPQASWNGDQLLTGSFILDPSQMNIYKISYGWLGIAPITFEVSANNGKNWTVIHTIDLRNSQTTPSISNPMLPMTTYVNTSVAPTTDVYIKTSCWNGGSIGGDSHGTSYVDRSFSIDAGSKAITAGVANALLTVRNPSTFAGKPNNIKSQLMFITATADGTQAVRITTKRGVTIGGTPSFNDVSTDNSQLQYDIAGTTATGGTASFPINLPKSGSANLYTKDFGLFLQPGEDVTFVAESGANSVVTLSIRERSFF